MEIEEAITFLKEKGYKIEEPENRFVEVKYGGNRSILLKDLDGDVLVRTWYGEEYLNDFRYFKENDRGQFWINGDLNKFEFLYKGEWLICDKEMDVRFLK